MHRCGGVTLLLLALAAACGDGDTPAAPTAAPPPGIDDPFALTVESRAASFQSQAILTVLEGEPLVSLSLVGGDDTDNYIAITAEVEGPENIRRLHSISFGTMDDSAAYASASLDGQMYSSRAGTFEVSFVPEGGLQGNFEITFLPFEELAAAGAAETDAVEPASGSLTLSGQFGGGFSIVCSSPIRGFTGGHAISNSPYCQSLKL